jgi:DNA-binding transcriptional LysR family regulator
MKLNVKRMDAVRLHAHWILYFHEVVQAGSIRQAARVLNVAPSAISRQMKEIESIIGGQLFDRARKGLRLTAAGEVVAEHVGQVLRGLGRMQDALDEQRGLRRGHVRIAAIQATAAEFLPKIVAAFRKKYPRITFTCNFVGSNEVAEHVVAGEADVGLSFNPPAWRTLRHLISVPLPFGAIMAPDFELSKHTTLRLYDLVDAQIPLILPDASISTRAIIDELLAKTSLVVQPVITTSHPDFIVGIAQYGAGIAFQTPVGIERELKDGSLVFIPLMEPTLKPPNLVVSVADNRPPSLTASVFAEAVRAAVAELLK